MARKEFPSTAAQALAGLRNGMTVMVGGFAGYGVPVQLMTALCESGVRDLTLITNDTTNLAAGKPSPSMLVEAGIVRRVICSFPVAGSASGGQAPAEALYRSGQVAVELVPQGTLAERVRCGGAGIPAFFTPTGVGTSFAEGKEVRVFEGEAQVLETALTADVALVRASVADTLGNLIYRRTAKNFNPLMAAAAKLTIAEVDRVVAAGELDPEVIGTPGIFVDRVYTRAKA
jgi:3-oxoadipate CoA-transferase alpha subunit